MTCLNGGMIYLRFAAFCMMLLVAGCGVKPRQVDPPPGASGNFPRTYPNPME
jgi:hypothetical protein